MKLVHTGDLHLGYRAYHRTNPRGINLREADVARAFRELLQRAAELQPDLLLVAGDVFHTVRPSNSAIADAFRQFAHFHQEAPDTRVLIIAGNHDSPKAVDTGSILRLLAEIENVQVVHHEAKRLILPDLDAAILCLPHNALAQQERLAIEPESGATHNILLAHAAIEDQRLKLLMDFGAATLASDAIDPDEWSYVALGHYHLRSRLAPNMVYPGAIERTSLNIWAEADNARRDEHDAWKTADWGKGFVEVDLAADDVRFHRLQSPRAVLDLEPILYSAMTPEELDGAIADALETVPGGIDEKIVRLRVFNVPREIYRELDHKRIREYRTRALHFRLDYRPPQIIRREGSAAPGQRLSLREELQSFLKHRWQTGSERVDRDALIDLGLRYLDRAEEAEALSAGS